MKHIAIAIQGGFAVAYQRHSGHLVAVSEHATRESAIREAQRLTLLARLDQERADRAALRQHGTRRPVRWFEPDAFA
ncbi:hypothetical protein [Simplicispira suum]|uniref:DUF2188 domain-containing protein n=1 Tax=Simplicispira suum TaxID=2109915 RepID=A0A2S0N3M3_9BURK|nr:hypothetical protein [Simplicispira suum]AVO42739.1 hypothetical protein C6571_16840 [Simplicispira suum]